MQNELYIVADAIKALRESRGLTQEQLAEKADISVSHLAKIETHARLMGMKTYIRLLEAMDIPIKEHFIHMGTAKKDMMLKEKIWYLVQDCDERETSLLIYSIEGIKKGLKKYFKEEVMPVLSPQIVDANHPFPHLLSKELYVVANLKQGDNAPPCHLLKFPLIPLIYRKKISFRRID